MSNDDEWAMFGSDSSDEEEVKVDTIISMHKNDVVGRSSSLSSSNENNTSTTKNKEEVGVGNYNNNASSTPLESSTNFFMKAADEVCLFLTKEFLTSNRSIPLHQRYFGVTALDQLDNDSNNSIDKKIIIHEEEKLWYGALTKKILQRNIQTNIISEDDDLDLDPDTNNKNDLQDGSTSKKCPYSKNDAGLIFCTFQEDRSNNLNIFCNYSQNVKWITKSRTLRKSIVPGGFLLLTMFIQSNLDAAYENENENDNNDKNNLVSPPRKVTEERNISQLISQWKINNEQIFHNAVWDIDNARFICCHHQSDNNNNNNNNKKNNKGGEIVTIYLMKRPCKVNTLSCPWKENNKHVPTSFYEQNDQVVTRSEQQQKETWLQYERRILADATVSLSVSELKSLDHLRSTSGGKQPAMTNENIQKAVNALRNHGFVILPSLFSSNQSITSIRSWSDAIMTDFHQACKILKSSPEHNVDIFNPGKDGTFDPISYKEMAMREDLRVDLRDGPNIKKLRDKMQQLEEEQLQHIGFYKCSLEDSNENDGAKPIIIDTDRSPQKYQKVDVMFAENRTQKSNNAISSSLRFDPSILEIVRSLLNPPHDSTTQKSTNQVPLYKGNFGRYNFNGKGPNGLPQPLRISGIGSVISLPQAGDQAIHADTPHLFETHDCLPCHYCNLFILGEDGSDEEILKLDIDGNPTGDNEVGGTAFIHGSHRLSVTANLTEGDEDTFADDVDNITVSAAVKEKARDEMHMRIIRPSLTLGDALLFDTRVLHFGLANQSRKKCRPMLYVNMTHSFFHDPKNWDNRKKIF